MGVLKKVGVVIFWWYAVKCVAGVTIAGDKGTREQRNGMLGIYFNPQDPVSRLAAMWWSKIFEKGPTGRTSTPTTTTPIPWVRPPAGETSAPLSEVEMTTTAKPLLPWNPVINIVTSPNGGTPQVIWPGLQPMPWPYPFQPLYPNTPPQQPSGQQNNQNLFNPAVQPGVLQPPGQQNNQNFFNPPAQNGVMQPASPQNNQNFFNPGGVMQPTGGNTGNQRPPVAGQYPQIPGFPVQLPQLPPGINIGTMYPALPISQPSQQQQQPPNLPQNSQQQQSPQSQGPPNSQFPQGGGFPGQNSQGPNVPIINAQQVGQQQTGAQGGLAQPQGQVFPPQFPQFPNKPQQGVGPSQPQFPGQQGQPQFLPGQQAGNFQQFYGRAPVLISDSGTVQIVDGYDHIIDPNAWNTTISPNETLPMTTGKNGPNTIHFLPLHQVIVLFPVRADNNMTDDNPQPLTTVPPTPIDCGPNDTECFNSEPEADI